ncbi:hypothetical protein RF11_11878 [Thelohanellus kitauei]|uniref:Alpha-soluble NSF attachment protein n=1 Tax=Thelohanellus kitauei TaxID=669202 RepID=A0A0C2N830_THEKT|nr:hypothetical protein RF11_11878 [Thelohanellus kitauei]
MSEGLGTTFRFNTLKRRAHYMFEKAGQIYGQMGEIQSKHLFTSEAAYAYNHAANLAECNLKDFVLAIKNYTLAGNYSLGNSNDFSFSNYSSAFVLYFESVILL